MKRVLVSGGSGFVGSNLVRRLLRDGHQVHLLLRPEAARWRLASVLDRLTTHVADLTDAAATARVVQQVKPQWVFHLSAFGAYQTQADAGRMIDNNVAGTLHLLLPCVELGFEAFVQAGSSSEYGLKDHAPTEQDWLEPNSYYAVTKAAATHLGRYLAEKHQLPITTLRLYSIYGPYEEPTRLIPTMAITCMQGRFPPLVHGKVARDFVYVDDAVDAFVLAADRSPPAGSVFNVATGVQTLIEEVVALAAEKFRISDPPQFGSMENRIWDTSCWVGDSRAIFEQLQWQPRHSFAEGFRQTVEWLQSEPEMLQYYRSAIIGV